MQKKTEVTSNIQVRVNTYEVMRRAVEEGVAYGWQRAHKHDDNPADREIISKMEEAVMSSICAVFVFEGEE